MDFRVSAITILFALAAAPLPSQWVKIPSAGVPRTPDGKPNLSAPAPRAAGGLPDLSGICLAPDQKYFMNLAADQPADVPLQSWARALSAERVENLHKDDLLVHCLPPGVPRINNFGTAPFKIIQTPSLVVILYEELNLWRQIFLDGRQLASNPNPTWMGYSTGRWDGDTLVVTSVGFNGQTWLDTEKGHPATDALQVTERFRRKDFGRLEIGVTIDDPKAYTRPWTATVEFRLLLGTELFEFICNENEQDIRHMVGK